MSARTVLVVDDEPSIQKALLSALQDEDYSVLLASSGKKALEQLKTNVPDVILLDIWMPDLDGIETLKLIKKDFPEAVVIMMSGHGTIETAVKATKLGAFDFIEKPLSLERLLVLLQNAIGVHELAQENQALRKQLQKSRQIIGKSPAILEIQDIIKRVAPTTGSVLITGENGTGKELVAHTIHALSTRFQKPLIEVNCAAIPEELIESELFGHEKGAFTGAVQMRRGKFDLAHTGTLFLDEIGDMSLKTQAKILRILQEQKFERVGGTQTHSVDVRILAATNKDLKAEIAKGNFREDLFYRLNVVPIQVPPLRSRKEDIPLLAQFFIEESCRAHSRKPRVFDDAAMQMLVAYSWPGNVREMKNLIERVVILTRESDDGRPVTSAELLSHLKDETLVPKVADESEVLHRNLRDARQEFEKEFILKTLREQDWNVSKTAQILGIERSYLHKKMKSFGIESEDRE